MEKSSTPICSEDIRTGLDPNATGEVFPLICPLTKTNCNSMCAVFKENRTTTNYRGTDEDISFRCDGHAFGRCDFFKFDIGVYRDHRG